MKRTLDDLPEASSEKASQHVLPYFYDAQQTPWSTIAEDVVAIEVANFGDKAFDEETLENNFSFSQSIIVVLRVGGEDGRVVGYAYAISADIVYDEDRVARPNTAYIVNIGIHPDHHKRRLSGPMMRMLEEELIRRGFTHTEGDYAKENNFADNIAKNYPGQIEESLNHDSEYGPQTFFRIRLTR